MPVGSAAAQCLGTRSDSFWYERVDNRARPLGKSRSHWRLSFVRQVFVPRVDAIAEVNAFRMPRHGRGGLLGRSALDRCGAFARSGVSGQLSKTNRFRHRRPRRRVGGGNHRIVRGKLPFSAILVRRQAVRHQMPLELLEMFAVLQADQIFRRDRLADRDGRILRLFFRGRIFYAGGKPCQSVMNCLDQCRQFAPRDGVIRDERGHHFGGHF